jgi:hypothetical protein
LAFATATIGVIVSTLLTACSSATEAETSNVSREAARSGVHLCIINNSSMNMRVTWANQVAEPLPPKGQNCTTGKAKKLPDISGVINYEPVPYPGTWLTLNVSASNESIGYPRVNVWYTAMNDKYGMCLYGPEGSETSMQFSWIRGTLRRENDTSDNKEFVIQFFDRENKTDFVSKYSACDGVDPGGE